MKNKENNYKIWMRIQYYKCKYKTVKANTVNNVIVIANQSKTQYKKIKEK